MKHRFAASVMFLVLVATPHAQTTSADERAIRELIARYGQGEPVARTDDQIFWTGAYKRPTVGSERGEEIPSGRQPSERVPGSQRNKTTPIRIEVAKSGDLAYEFSSSELSFDLKNGTREILSTSTLRVWRKEGGQWKIAAWFNRPHYQEPSTGVDK
jgi:hypothetical protein